MIPSAITATAIVASSAYLWVRWNERQWKKRATAFHAQQHGYTTTGQKQAIKKVVLLIVVPTSGCGKAMKEYPGVIETFEAQGRQVEVYVTSSGYALSTLAIQKDLQPYKLIVFLSGDSSVFEFVKPIFQEHPPDKAKWPFAPILHLPGGIGNAMPREFYGASSVPIREIIKNASKIRKGGVIKASNGKQTYYALHNCCDGVQVALLDWFEDCRAFVSAFDIPGFIILLLVFLGTYPFRRVNPVVLNICKSAYDGGGQNLGFDVNRFDGKTIAVKGGPYKSKWELLKAYLCFQSGNLGKLIEQDQTEAATHEESSKLIKEAQVKRMEPPNGLSASICGYFKAQAQVQFHLYFDGSTALALKGETLTFQVIPDCIPYCII